MDPHGKMKANPRLILILAAALGTGGSLAARADTEGPLIDVWHGTNQTYGVPGVTQRWMNVLGNVSDADGVDTLSYTLNGGTPVDLTIGPDTRRLADEGDFNVDIKREDLLVGANTVTITATDTLANVSTVDVTVNYVDDQVWPLDTTMDWATLSDVTEGAQMVDGLWTLDPGGVRTVQIDYDRVIALGDYSWTDYEVTVPITVHWLDPDGFLWPSVSPGCGLILRWRGHSEWDDAQPAWGYSPVGATLWYDWGMDGPVAMSSDRGFYESDDMTLQLGVTYMHKFRVETAGAQGTLYRSKVWEAGQPEPTQWMLEGIEPPGDYPSGSLLLVAHHVDATFGNVVMSSAQDSLPPSISDVNVIPGHSTAVISWTTSESASSRVDYGPTDAYEDGFVEVADLVTYHELLLEGLSPEQTYHYQITSEDLAGNPASTADATFLASGTAEPVGIVSDDFNAVALDTGIWTQTDPLGDTTLTMTDFQARFDLPADTAHVVDGTATSAPRIMQSIRNQNFDVTVGFDSLPVQEGQRFGILVSGYASTRLRLDVSHDGATARVGATAIVGAGETVFLDAPITTAGTLTLRSERVGDTWTLSYALDGAPEVVVGSFSFAMAAKAIGPFVGNEQGAGGVPAHTALVDYFFDTNAPIDPEDPDPCPGEPDVDTDGDGVRDCIDGCPNDINKTEPGVCGCGVADDDSDGDSVPDCIDQCPGEPDTDSDGDGVADCLDQCPGEPDTDTDGDQTPDCLDDCPLDPNKTTDVDTDGDGVLDCNDGCPGDIDKTDPGACGCGVPDDDTDGDTVPDCIDQCPGEPDTDTDGDGVADCVDQCPGSPDVDSDGDGVLDCNDGCPNDADKTDPGDCGCGVPDEDNNGNGISDCLETDTIDSDDFNAMTLDPQWTFVDPKGDCTLATNGFQVVIDVPGGDHHDVWSDGIDAPRILQDVDDVDFGMEVRYESIPAVQYQSQGVLVMQDGSHLIRLDFYYDGATTRLFGATFVAGSPTVRLNVLVGSATTAWNLRLLRQGDDWAVDYAIDDGNWIDAGTFTHTLQVASVGPYIGNAGVTAAQAPAYTGVIDYVFNSASPIDPEDPDGCPADPLKTDPGVCGCGTGDEDLDQDGVMDCEDDCPNTIPGIAVDAVGCPVNTVAADLDHDGDVDGADITLFQGCMTGYDIGPPAPGCVPADFEADDDVDLGDYASLQLCLSGEDQPVDTSCMD